VDALTPTIRRAFPSLARQNDGMLNYKAPKNNCHLNQTRGVRHGKPSTEKQPRKEEAESREEQNEGHSAGLTICISSKSDATNLRSHCEEDGVGGFILSLSPNSHLRAAPAGHRRNLGLDCIVLLNRRGSACGSKPSKEVWNTHAERAPTASRTG
jgi:hypothetical protein